MTSPLKFRVLTSYLTSRVSCLSQRARQNFPAPLKIETLCLIGKKNKSYINYLILLYRTLNVDYAAAIPNVYYQLS